MDDRLAVDEQGIAAQGRDGAEFALGKDGVGCLEQDVFDLSAPRLAALASGYRGS